MIIFIIMNMIRKMMTVKNDKHSCSSFEWLLDIFTALNLIMFTHNADHMIYINFLNFQLP